MTSRLTSPPRLPRYVSLATDQASGPGDHIQGDRPDVPWLAGGRRQQHRRKSANLQPGQHPKPGCHGDSGGPRLNRSRAAPAHNALPEVWYLIRCWQAVSVSPHQWPVYLNGTPVITQTQPLGTPPLPFLLHRTSWPPLISLIASRLCGPERLVASVLVS